MDPKFQTSFIPKGTIGSQRSSASIVPTFNIFDSLASIAFIVTLVLVFGTFGYEYYLNSQIKNADALIIEAKQAYNLEAVQNIIDANLQITYTKKILESHTATSQLFELLQSSTLRKISFNNFTYVHKEGYNGITMDVEAQSYNALAQQYEIFSQSSFVQNPHFSNFELTDNGNIRSKFTALIEQDLVSYKKAIENSSQN